MSETVKVISASNPNPWEHGITYYDMVFDRGGQPFSCSWGTKGGEPQSGEEVTGEFSQKSDGSWKFTKGSKDKPSSGGSTETRAGSQNQSGQYQTPQPPDAVARMGRAAAQKSAIAAATSAGYFQGEITITKLRDNVVPLIDWFAQDIDKAGQAAKQAVGTERSESAVTSLPSASSQPASPPANPSLAEIEQALDTAGLTLTLARQKVADFMITQLPPERVIKAVNNLVNSSDLEIQGATLKALKENTESWTGGPLPTDPVPGDEPPF